MQPVNHIQILIVEDNLVVADSIKQMLSNLNYHLVDIVIDYESAVAILAVKPVQIVLIDIVLAGSKTGIELGAHIRASYHIPFIFITSNSDKNTVSKAKMVKPNGYLVKPFERQDLFTAIEIALFNFSELEETEPTKRVLTSILTDSIFIKKQHIFHKILFNDIQYIKADNVYLEVYTIDKTFLVRATLKKYLTKLPAHLFYRAHKSFVVNIDHIKAVNAKDIIVSGREIPISKDFKDFLVKTMNS